MSDTPNPEAYAAAMAEHGERRILVDLSTHDLTTLVASLQLALRHPQYPAYLRRIAQPFLDQTIANMRLRSPAIADVMAAGNDAHQDLPPAAPPAPSLTIRIEPTDQLVEIEGCLCRVWHGLTDDQVRCRVFVRLVAVAEGEDMAAFDQALQATLQPGRLTTMEDVLRPEAQP